MAGEASMQNVIESFDARRYRRRARACGLLFHGTSCLEGDGEYKPRPSVPERIGLIQVNVAACRYAAITSCS
jgi:hypothetical protein